MRGGSQQENGCALTHSAPSPVKSQRSGKIGKVIWARGDRQERGGGARGRVLGERERERERGVAFSVCLPTAQISAWNSVPFHTFTRNEMRWDGGSARNEKERRMPSVMSPRSLEGESLVRARVRPYQRSRPSSAGIGGPNIFSSNKHFFTVRSVRPSVRLCYYACLSV